MGGCLCRIRTRADRVLGGGEGPFPTGSRGADDRDPVRIVRGPSALRRPTARWCRRIVDRRSVGGMEHSDQGLSGCPDGDAAVRHHPAGGPGRRPAVAAHAHVGRGDSHVFRPLRRRGRRPVHAHAGRAAGARHALNLTAVVAGHRVRSGSAVRQVVRTRRTGPLGAGESRLRRQTARTPAGRAHSWAIAAVLPVCAGVIFGIGVVAQW